VRSNRKGGPEGVIDLIEARAPGGFDDIDRVASSAEREGGRARLCVDGRLHAGTGQPAGHVTQIAMQNFGLRFSRKAAAAIAA
jgi:hypothetical protein